MAWFCLHKLEPGLFGEKPDNESRVILEGREVDILCFALRKHRNHSLPTQLYVIPDTVEALGEAFAEHYTNIGKPLSVPVQSMGQIFIGYFRLNEETKKVTCTLDTREEKAEIDFSYSDKLAIHNCFEWDSKVTITLKGREMESDSLMDDFAALGVEFPDETWKGGFTEAPLPEPAAKKAKTEPLTGGISASSTPKKGGGSTNAVLSDALRKRLAAKGADKNNT